ncbi:unnamed protein product [Cochlearia groenlandica]
MKTKANSVLEKKLNKIESLLETITINGNDNNPSYLYRNIQLRIGFAKTLLSAEITSRTMHVDGEEGREDTLELASMAKRLTGLEEDFKTKLSSSGYDIGLMVEQEERSLVTNVDVEDVETGSVYSVVESCHNEEKKKEEEEKKKEKEEKEETPLFQDASSEEKEEEEDAASEEKEEVVEEEVVAKEVKVKRRFGFRALVCVGLVCFGLGALVGLMIGYIGHDNMVENEFFLPPT